MRFRVWGFEFRIRVSRASQINPRPQTLDADTLNKPHGLTLAVRGPERAIEVQWGFEGGLFMQELELMIPFQLLWSPPNHTLGSGRAFKTGNQPHQTIKLRPITARTPNLNASPKQNREPGFRV